MFFSFLFNDVKNDLPQYIGCAMIKQKVERKYNER